MTFPIAQVTYVIDIDRAMHAVGCVAREAKNLQHHALYSPQPFRHIVFIDLTLVSSTIVHCVSNMAFCSVPQEKEIGSLVR